MSHIMEVFWLCKKYVSKKKMSLKHLKIDHVEYYAYTYLSLCRMNFKTAVLWVGVGRVAKSV